MDVIFKQPEIYGSYARVSDWVGFCICDCCAEQKSKIPGVPQKGYFPAFGFVIGCCCYDLADCVQQRHWTYIGYNGKDWDGRHCTALAG